VHDCASVVGAEYYSALLAVTLNDIDKRISTFKNALSSLPQSNHRRAGRLSTLGHRQLNRFYQTGDMLDLETSILQFTHAIFLSTHLASLNEEHTVPIFYLLVTALFCRSHEYKRSSDVRFCVKFLRFLRDLSPNAIEVTTDDVAALLIPTLALQIRIEPVTEISVIQEMSLLSRGLISSDLPRREIYDSIETFAGAVMKGFIHEFKQPPQQVIECLREANIHLPGLPNLSLALLQNYVVQFHTTRSNDDYERAMAVLDEILATYSPSSSPTHHLESALSAAAGMAHSHFTIFENPEYLEVAISRFRGYLSFLPPGDPNRGRIFQAISELERSRNGVFGVVNDLSEVDSNGPEAVDHPSFSQPAAFVAELNAVMRPMTEQDCSRHLGVVRDMSRIINEAEVEEAAKYCRLLLKSLQQTSDNLTPTRHFIIFFSGHFFLHAFRLTNNLEYLNESIDACRGLLEIQRARLLRVQVVHLLILSLTSRLTLSKERRDLDEIMRLFPIVATEYQNAHTRFEVSCEWTLYARAFRHSSTSTAYKSAISSMQDFLAFAPTLETQHFRLLSIGGFIQTLPLEYASYQIHIGQLKEAIETLEQGRGLLWSELRGMRTSIDQLLSLDSRLAEKFAAVNQDLEAVTTSCPPIFLSNDGGVHSSTEADQFGDTMIKGRKLLDERTDLITQIRSLPGFRTFLMSPSFDNLRSVAAHGPVIIINHCMWQSGIIILLHDSPPSYIPTSDDFYGCARALQGQLLASRKKGLDSKEFENALSSVLEGLYNLVGRPVIQRFRELNIPEQSRIWWCPTSIFCSLPLHAMGPVRSEGPLKLYFSDLYISSYTPTLSALIESRKHGSHSIEKPSILLVAQPDKFMPKAWNEISLIQRLDTTVTTLCSKKATPPVVMKRLQEHRFAHFPAMAYSRRENHSTPVSSCIKASVSRYSKSYGLGYRPPSLPSSLPVTRRS
jgi:tetratricopeptide (TPR) repeat protein